MPAKPRHLTGEMTTPQNLLHSQAARGRTAFHVVSALLATIIVLFGECFADDTAAATNLYRRGRYEEAEATFAKMPDTIEKVVGQAQCAAAVGKSTEAIARLQWGLVNLAPSAPLQAQLAELLFEHGEYEDAAKFAAAALAIDSSSIQARLVRADLHRVHGRIEEATIVYGQLATVATDQVTTDDALRISRARTILGRWNRDTQVFDQLVNGLYPSIQESDENAWRSHLEAGKLFLEKYNVPDAAREFNAALSINPRAAEVHVEMARLSLQQFNFQQAIASVERALKVNPHLPAALRMTADLAFANLEPAQAAEPLRLAMERNAHDERTLGRLYAVYLRRDGFDSVDDPGSQASQLALSVEKRNPQCGRFFESAADSFNALRYYPLAARHYQKAIEHLPQLISARGKLGQMQMRLGEEADARRTLETSFELDPFNVRVKNALDVLDLLDTYAVIETDHFILRFDRGHDGLLAEYAARYLEEEVYPDIVKVLGYEPADKTLLEIFSKANGTSGHAWFSARMVGLPFIGTVGACAGKMFALTSPADGKPYNWARVLRHEFVHVVNLQQTNFLIPHWFTEAIAVRNEMGNYPADWDRVLAKYVAENNLFDLSNINHGFVRPGNSERWTLAYFQAYLYADYLVQRAGDEALQTMLAGYADGQTTAEILGELLNQSLPEFEADYREHLASRVAGPGVSSPRPDKRSANELEAELRASPRDAALLAQLAVVRLKAGATRAARKAAERSIESDPANPVARYVMARIMFSVGEDERAWEHVELGLGSGTNPAGNPEQQHVTQKSNPDQTLLKLAAGLKLEAREFTAARAYYERGRQAFPHDFSWIRGLARVALANDDDESLAKWLAVIAEREADKTTLARKLTQLAFAREDFKAAEYWANRVLHVDVMNPMAHADRGRALAKLGNITESTREFETALRLSPGEREWQRQLEQLKAKRPN